ncbi:hypothetical protein AA0472_2585 [Acetobacter estunensis NRIC 0472]|uniref:Uncharacterized protein n=1 Tax=Acetobacter estunensis TaxID=104097 RepID=A0A967BB04_9PROT|nr:hypothetical protein [Acetobacter estunensis]NHO55391.1 hypothetical protein [Acetobacter estunensis]GBQ28110.1 hypothetical protein AA0472_2585 [Acetobacter estunensis NRIC 0472]
MSNAAATIAPNASENKGDALPKATREEARRAKEARARFSKEKKSGIELADVLALAPNDDQITKIQAAFAVEIGDLDELIGLGSNMIRDQFETLRDVLVTLYRGEDDMRGMKLHLDRIVDGAIRSAHGAACYYEARRQIAKDEADSFTNANRDEDRMGIDGQSNRVERLREIAAQHGAKAHALACVARGACAGYAEVMGEEWKPYVAQQNGRSVSEQAAALRAEALDL